MCRVFVVCGRELGPEEPIGDCHVCGGPLCQHEKRVSLLVTVDRAMVVNEEPIVRWEL